MPKAVQEPITPRRTFLSIMADIAAAFGIPRRSVAPPAAPATRIPRAPLHQYADRFLNTEVAVIAENQTHVVLAIRIPLETIASNHHLLRDLSDACGRVRA